MKTCNNCHTTLPDDQNVCPNCGASLNEAADTAAKTPETPKKRKHVGLIVGIAAAVVVLAVALVILIPRLTAGKPLTMPVVNAYGYDSHTIHYSADADGDYVYSYLDQDGKTVSVPEKSINTSLDEVVADCSGQKLTNRELMYYYDQQFYILYNTFGQYTYYFIDPSLSYDEQLDMNGQGTWEQYFLDQCFTNFQQLSVLYQEAEANGFTMPEDAQAELDNLDAELAEVAAEYGFASADAYVKYYFGPGASLDGYREYLRMSQLASTYYSYLYDQLTCTDEEISDYYDAHAEEIRQNYYATKVDKNVISVRHILIAPEDTASDESWAAAETEANRIYEEWLAGDATEESFAEMANTYSTDTGSNTNGGLYEDVFPGQMVDTFNDWCFADGRTVGDSGIVKTDYGYHIMFFSGEGDYIYWRDLAKNLVLGEQIDIMLQGLADNYSFTAYPEKVVLLNNNAATTPEAADTEVSDTETTDGAAGETTD